MLATFGTLRASAPLPPPLGITPQVWEAAADGGADALVLFKEQADLSAAEEMPLGEERRRSVYEALRTTALRSQADLRTELDAAGVDYRSFYLVNMIAVRGGRELLSQLAAHPEVERIAPNPSVRQEMPDPRFPFRSQAAEGIEWNVQQVNADDVWALGYTGEGIVVAGQDTGYDWDHPALIDRYRGYNGMTVTHDYNWHDAIHSPGSDCGADSPVPCDDNGHGTHTMGTIVGDDGDGNRIGVAPGAAWIGCRNMDEGVGSPATYAECFEFFLAPYPVGGDPLTDGEPSRAPHVINNSWTCPPSEGCDPETLRAVVENVRAAGIVVVASAGNSGPACGSVEVPPPIYDAAFSVGATDWGDNIADFSSRGPVLADGSGRMKPDVSAPGVGVRSSFPGGGYGLLSGTSMAGPHVAGNVALLWSAAPSLIGDVDTTEEIVARTARPRTTIQGCGGDDADDVPNNAYGWGIVDALAAIPQTWVAASGQAEVLDGVPASEIRYTLRLTNTSALSLTSVTISQTLPVSSTLMWGDSGYQVDGRVVHWRLPVLAPGSVVSRRLEVALTDPRAGARLTSTYELRAAGPAVPLGEPEVGVDIPWRVLVLPVFKDARLEVR